MVLTEKLGEGKATKVWDMPVNITDYRILLFGDLD